MVKIPLNRRIKKKQQKALARVQDVLVEVLYDFFPNCVLHGGASIWRCYGGNRFSEVVDAYLKKNKKKIEEFFSSLASRGFDIIKKRIKERSLYSQLTFGRTELRFEAVFKSVEGELAEYETYEGGSLNIYTLIPEELVKEKVSAYLKRRKIRDLYDVFFLLRHVKYPEKVRPPVKKLLKNFKEPVDKKELKSLLLFGAVPDEKKMLTYMRRWLK